MEVFSDRTHHQAVAEIVTVDMETKYFNKIRQDLDQLMLVMSTEGH